ncbi:MAG: hypothetical protein ACLPQS_06530 [Acidimicrobiales bacterium]
MGTGRTFVAGVLFVLALVALALGALYIGVSAHSLPSFIPGHSSNVLAVGKHTKRGIAGLAAGAVLLVISIALVASGRRKRRY